LEHKHSINLDMYWGKKSVQLDLDYSYLLTCKITTSTVKNADIFVVMVLSAVV